MGMRVSRANSDYVIGNLLCVMGVGSVHRIRITRSEAVQCARVARTTLVSAIPASATASGDATNLIAPRHQHALLYSTATYFVRARVS